MKKTNIELQYDEIRQQIPSDYLLFFQIGDFFELLNDDAVKIHMATGITLTKRGNMPMAGMPCRNVMFYVKKLVFDHNYTIALCEQTDNINGKLVERKITKICSRGTIYDELSHEYNMVMSIYISNNIAYLVYGDISTQDVFIENMNIEELETYISKIKPVKIISNINIVDIESELINTVNHHECSIYLSQEEQTSFNMLLEFFSIKGYTMVPNIHKPTNEYMYIHANTLKHLEIFSDINGNKNNSIFAILNKTQTGMGYRLLQQQLRFPSINSLYLTEYYNEIEKFINIKNSIKFNIGDMHRNINNLNNISNVKRLGMNIQNSKNLIEEYKNIIPTRLLDQYKQLENFHLDKFILDICEDDSHSTSSISDLETEISNIMNEVNNLPHKLNITATVDRNNVIGMFFKTSDIIYDKAFLPKKGTKDTFRYTHAELMALENKILAIEETIEENKQKIFNDMVIYIKKFTKEIILLSNIIAEIDVIHSKAQIAIEYDLHKPVISYNKQIDIRNGYNLILKSKTNNICINNDLSLTDKLIILTGINMGGKSTYLKQNAIIILMAQAGFYVPGSYNCSIVKGLFVRMGAYDDIFNGASTFYTEMMECSMFLKRATHDSLIILDEIGRGTAYKEGLYISQAICEFIINLGAFCIVSTHYLELPYLIDNIISKQISYVFQNNKVTFLYKIIDGCASTSLSINTIQQVGMPQIIYNRAKQLMNINI